MAPDVEKQVEPIQADMPRKPGASTLCTEQLHKFLSRHIEIFDFFFFNVHLAHGADNVATTAIEALAAGGRKEDIERLERRKANPTPNFNKLVKFSAIQSENMIIRSTDNFLCYVSESIQSVMRKRPELLRSSETIKVEEVLKFKRNSELIEYLVERKINELSYGGIKEVIEFLRERTSLALHEKDDEFEQLSVTIEARNIYTHNRGIINDVFLRKIPSTIRKNYRKGTRLSLGFSQVVDLTNNMYRLAVRLDEKIATKFRISRKRFSNWSLDQLHPKAVNLSPRIREIRHTPKRAQKS